MSDTNHNGQSRLPQGDWDPDMGQQDPKRNLLSLQHVRKQRIDVIEAIKDLENTDPTGRGEFQVIPDGSAA